MNDINNLYPVQNKKSLDWFQSKLIALQQILASFFLSYCTLAFLFTDATFQQKKKTIQNHLRNKTDLALKTVEVIMLQKYLFKQFNFLFPPEMYTYMHVTLNTSLIQISPTGLLGI